MPGVQARLSKSRDIAGPRPAVGKSSRPVPEARDIVTVVVDGDEITITWMLEDGSTRDVVYTTGEFSISFP